MTGSPLNIVAGGNGREVRNHPPAPEPAAGPEPAPPPPPPPEDTPASIGATFAPDPSPDVADELADSLAGKLRAKIAASRTGEQAFDLPGFDGGLVLVARALHDARRLQAGMRPAAFIAHCTVRLELVEDDGSRTDLGGWGEQLAELMGVNVAQSRTPASDLVSFVLDNEARVDAFARTLLSWMIGEQVAAEQAAGE